MKEIAIITGASSGLGRVFVEAVIEKYPQLDEIWLIARHKELLEKFAGKYPAQNFKILPLDLTVEKSFAVFRETLKQEQPLIKLLINDAGIVSSKPFQKISLQRQEMMIKLNAEAPMILCYDALPYMQADSGILNVCSVAGFAPTPNMTTYSATKAFLYDFSKGLYAELKERGIHVLALCPGNMKTGMFQTNGDLPKERSVVDILPFLDLRKITHDSLEKLEAGQMVFTPGAIYKLYRVIAKLVPHKFLMHFSKV